MEMVQNTCLKSYQDKKGNFKSGVPSAWTGHNWGLCKKCGKLHVRGKGWLDGLTKDTNEKVKEMGQKVSNRITLLWQDPEYRQRQIEARQESIKFQNSSGRFKKGQIPHNKGGSNWWLIEAGKKRRGIPSGRKGEIHSEFVTAECDFCGKEIVRRKSEFEKQFHIFCNRDCCNGWRKTDDFKKAQGERTSRSQKVVWQNLEYKEKMKKQRKDLWQIPSFKEKRKQASINAWDNNPERRLKQSIFLKSKYENGYVNPRKGIKEEIEHKNKRISKILSKVCQRPNNFEQRCGEELKEQFGNKFKYCGNGSVMINGKSPDYICEDLKIVVLCNGLYWHLWRFGLKDTPEDKQKVELKESEPFIKAGYEVWFIWEDTK